jgi:hypothetical protein
VGVEDLDVRDAAGNRLLFGLEDGVCVTGDVEEVLEVLELLDKELDPVSVVLTTPCTTTRVPGGGKWRGGEAASNGSGEGDWIGGGVGGSSMAISSLRCKGGTGSKSDGFKAGGSSTLSRTLAGRPSSPMALDSDSDSENNSGVAGREMGFV